MKKYVEPNLWAKSTGMATLRLIRGPSWHLKTVEIVDSVKIDNVHSENDAKTDIIDVKRKTIS